MTEDLIRRLEESPRPHFVLEQDIAKVIGEPWEPPRAYMASLDAARSISDWVLLYASDIGADGLALVKLGDPSQSPAIEVTGIHADLEIAWCIAALKARTRRSKMED